MCAATCGSIRQLLVGMKLELPNRLAYCVSIRVADSLANGEHLAEQHSVEGFVQVPVSTETQGR